MELRPSLLKRELRQQIFILFASWSGKFGRPFGVNSSERGSASSKETEPTELQLTSVEAMSSVLCCGPCFNKQGLTEDSHSDIYSWLDVLLSSKSDKVTALHSSCNSSVKESPQKKDLQVMERNMRSFLHEINQESKKLPKNKNLYSFRTIPNLSGLLRILTNLNLKSINIDQRKISH